MSDLIYSEWKTKNMIQQVCENNGAFHLLNWEWRHTQMSRVPVNKSENKMNAKPTIND